MATKTTKATKTETMNKADQMRVLTEKAIAEKRSAIRSTNKYQRILEATEKAIEDAAKEGYTNVVIPTIMIDGELGAPAIHIGHFISVCENPKAIVDTLVEDMEAQGYKTMNLFGAPMMFSWAKSEDK
jgi:hypothetical protein